MCSCTEADQTLIFPYFSQIVTTTESMLLINLFPMRDHALASLSVNRRDLKGSIAFLVSVTTSDTYAWRSIDCFIYYGNIVH